jgi:DNA-binding Lrp family transcriptional regulator
MTAAARQSNGGELERRLVAAVEAGLPLVPYPYAHIAAELGVSERQVIDTLKVMLARGAIRRIGAVPNHYALGYRANGMAVFDVDDDRIAELGPEIGALDFVSHCYRRPRHPPLWPYNLFAMVHAKSRDAVEAKVRQIKHRLGDACRGETILYSSRILKKTGLRLRR